MALQDLTPQLRTRLSRMERAVGWFVVLAIALLAAGFVYYAYNTAARKGWFLTRAPYFTFVNNASGLKVGDPVMLMGFPAGAITEITPMPAHQFDYNVYVKFELKDPNYGYIWTEGSQARIAAADFLGTRAIEVTKGTGGYPTYEFKPIQTMTSAEALALPNPGEWVLGQEIYEYTNVIARALTPLPDVLPILREMELKRLTLLDNRTDQVRNTMTCLWNTREGRYVPYTNNVSAYWLQADESPAVTERLEQVMNQVQEALPGIFALTNQLAAVLSNTAALTANLNTVATNASPLVQNLAQATAQLDRPGGLGEWLVPTNINSRLEGALGSLSATSETVNTNLSSLAGNLNRSLDNLAGITSNLNAQVHSNTNILSGISQAIVHADELVQGLKRHWLLRSAFKEKKSRAPSGPPPKPIRSPKDAAR